MGCSGLHRVAHPAYLSRILFSAMPGLHRIAFPVVSEWCQKQVDGTSPIPLQVRLGKQSLRGGFARAIRQGDDGVEGLVVRFLAATASSSARSLPLLCGSLGLLVPLDVPPSHFLVALRRL